MKKINELIEWYGMNANNMYDDMIVIELEKIKKLYKGYEDHTNEVFVFEMMESLLKVIEYQRERRECLDYELELRNSSSMMNGYIANNGIGSVNNFDTSRKFQNDKQLQDTFTAYCLNNEKSLYTANDYCTRIRNLWSKFLDEYSNETLSKEVDVEKIHIYDSFILLNAYYNMQSLKSYIELKVSEDKGNRNLLNSRAALKKLEEFKKMYNQ